jgi:hypothetical protein
MDERPYYSTIVEQLSWSSLVESGGQVSYIFDHIQHYCPGNYIILFAPDYYNKDCLVNCGSMGIHLLFKNKYERIAWIMKWS